MNILAGAYAAGLFCHMTIDQAAARKLAGERFANGPYPPSAIADSMWAAVNEVSLRLMLTRVAKSAQADLTDYCMRSIEKWGPQGWQAKGLLK